MNILPSRAARDPRERKCLISPALRPEIREGMPPGRSFGVMSLMILVVLR
jgi:hypothetical protein